MKTKVLAFIVVIGLAVASCTKTNTTNAVPDKVKTVSLISASPADSFILSYDASNRLVSFVAGYSQYHPNIKVLYSYNPDNFTMLSSEDDSTSYHETFFLKNGLVDSTYSYEEGYSPNASSTSKYFYNSNNQLIRQNDYAYSAVPDSTKSINTSYFYYDANGNVIKDSLVSGVYTYEYYLDSSANFDLSVIPYLEWVKSVNLLKTRTFTFYTGSNVVIDHYAYILDDKKRVIEQSSNHGPTYRYTYY